MPHSVVFLHTSPAAVGPVANYYGQAAPELAVTNLLDDGLLRLLAAGEPGRVERRLGEMLASAKADYAVRAALVTCSSVARDSVERLEAEAGLPVVKIDAPMAALAVQHGRRIGVAATFAATIGPTTRLLNEAAADAGAEVTIETKLMEDAYRALLGGQPAEHDRIVVAGVRELASRVDVVVLAQVSMARVQPLLADAGVRVLSSLDTSLAALRDRLTAL